MAKKENRVPISDEDWKELMSLRKLIKTRVNTLRKKPALKKLISVIPVYSMDPNNPDQLEVCMQIIIDNGDNSFSAYCICNHERAEGLCKGSTSPA